MKDEEIIAAIQSGGSNRKLALKSIYTNASIRQGVKHIIMEFGGSEVDADDFFNEALIIFDRNVRNNKFEGQSSISTYYISIAKYIYLSHRRKESRNISLDHMEGLGALKNAQIDNQIELNDETELAERKEMLRDIIARANETCKKLFKLYMLNLSYQDMAAEMGHENPNSTKNALYRCREKLRKAIKQRVSSELVYNS